MSVSNTLKVIKRDGKKENFEPFKIMRIALAAGLDEKEAGELQKKVIVHVQKKAVANKNEILSTDIRDYFIKELKNTNEYAAGLYEWYEKTKES